MAEYRAHQWLTIYEVNPEIFCNDSPELPDYGRTSSQVDLPFARVEDTYQQLLQQNGGYVLVACDRASVIGVLRLSILPNPRLQHTGRLGSLAVHPNHQGKGAGSALFKAVLDLADNWLNLRRLELLVYADNQAAIGLYQKYGFETEGTLRDFALRAGRYVNGLIMARLPRSASPTT
ncbi:MAG: GNAT family N-acetyltransferase [Nodosilinea sp.]